jgi:hypothetical protein
MKLLFTQPTARSAMRHKEVPGLMEIGELKVDIKRGHVCKEEKL